mgnify:FL=1
MEKVCVFTGHRFVPAQERARLQRRLIDTVESLYADGYRTFCAGGALGFDRMAADTVLALRQRYSDLRLLLMVPCRDQAARWRAEDRMAYERQLRDADEVRVLSEHYYDGCMRERNRCMIDLADCCVAYVTSPHSGSAQTMRMAQTRHIPVLNLA